jgi:hypothetical protein
VASGAKDRDERAARERARVYRARQQFHDGRISRRRRDNIVAGVVGALIVLAAAGSQVAYFTAGPGAPAPAPTSTSTPGPDVSPSPDAPATSPAPEPDPTPEPTP